MATTAEDYCRVLRLKDVLHPRIFLKYILTQVYLSQVAYKLFSETYNTSLMDYHFESINCFLRICVWNFSIIYIPEIYIWGRKKAKEQYKQQNSNENW